MDDDRYHGERTVAFTICVAERARLFTNPVPVQTGVQFLTELSTRHKCTVPVYCFMPDHVHFMVRGSEASSRPLEVARGWKNRLGSWLAHHGYAERLQPGFYDHVIRQSEDWRNQALYIAMNPVRAGLIDNLYDFPFTGTIGGDLQDLVTGF